jgi:hypothetical protein
MKSMQGLSLVWIGLLAAGGATMAQAESLTIAGIYPAGEDAPSEVREIAIDNFGGQAGERLAFAIEDNLRGARIEGEEWFTITLNSTGRDVVIIYDRREGAQGAPDIARSGPEAVLRGTASVEVNEYASGTKDVEKCVKRDDRDDCIERKTETYKCRTLAVNMRPELRLVARAGRSLYSRSELRTNEERFCADEQYRPSVDNLVQRLIDAFASEVRYDLAPVQRVENVRVLETRKGLAKADSTAFRAAVQLTKNDPYGACLEFGRLEATNPDHTSVLFNIGLCHEGAGDLDAAEDYYRRTLALKAGTDYAESGLSRIASRRRAEMQLAMHYGSDDEE